MMSFVAAMGEQQAKLGNVFLLAIVGVSLLGSCFISAGGLCQQYGHSCLGGHGKRDAKTHPLPWSYFLQQLMKYPDSRSFVKSPTPRRHSSYSNAEDEDTGYQKVHFIPSLLESQMSGVRENDLFDVPGNRDEDV